MNSNSQELRTNPEGERSSEDAGLDRSLRAWHADQASAAAAARERVLSAVAHAGTTGEHRARSVVVRRLTWARLAPLAVAAGLVLLSVPVLFRVLRPVPGSVAGRDLGATTDAPAPAEAMRVQSPSGGAADENELASTSAMAGEATGTLATDGAMTTSPSNAEAAMAHAPAARKVDASTTAAQDEPSYASKLDERLLAMSREVAQTGTDSRAPTPRAKSEQATERKKLKDEEGKNSGEGRAEQSGTAGMIRVRIALSSVGGTARGERLEMLRSRGAVMANVANAQQAVPGTLQNAQQQTAPIQQAQGVGRGGARGPTAKPLNSPRADAEAFEWVIATIPASSISALAELDVVRRIEVDAMNADGQAPARAPVRAPVPAHQTPAQQPTQMPGQEPRR